MGKEYEIFELLNKEYLDVYEKMYLEDRCEFLFAVWRDLILPNSDKKIKAMEEEKLSVFIEANNEFTLYYGDNTTIGLLDEKVVTLILRMSTKLKRISIIDFIFKRTKSAAKTMPQYFYPEKIIQSYIKLLEIDKAKSVLEYMSKIEHRSYWYRIVDINIEKYRDYPDFFKLLKEVRYKSIASLLKSGEQVDIKLNLTVLNEINQYI